MNKINKQPEGEDGLPSKYLLLDWFIERKNLKSEEKNNYSVLKRNNY